MTTQEQINTIEAVTPRQFTLVIVESVGARHGVSVKAIMSEDRGRVVVRARHEAWAEVYVYRPHWSYPELGRRFNRDHSTIMYGIKKVVSGIIGQFCAALQIDWKGGAQ